MVNNNRGKMVTIKGKIVSSKSWDGKREPMLKTSVQGNNYYSVAVELSEDLSTDSLYLQADSIMFLFFWEKSFWGGNNENLSKIRRLRADNSKVFEVRGIVKKTRDNNDTGGNLMSVFNIKEIDELYGDSEDNYGVFI